MAIVIKATLNIAFFHAWLLTERNNPIRIYPASAFFVVIDYKIYIYYNLPFVCFFFSLCLPMDAVAAACKTTIFPTNIKSRIEKYPIAFWKRGIFEAAHEKNNCLSECVQFFDAFRQCNLNIIKWTRYHLIKLSGISHHPLKEL